MNNKEKNDQQETKEKIETEDIIENKHENLEESDLTKNDEPQVEADSTEEENEENAESEEERLQEEVRALKEDKIRVLAEMENLRKRFDREKIDSIKYGSVNFARDILSPGDNLERALSAINQEEDHPQSIKNLIEGLKMVQKEFSSALEKNGISKINSMNEKFDPNLHQAMMEVERDDLDEGVVVQEIQTGYMMHDRLLRTAMVGVSKKTNQNNTSDVKVKKNLKNKD
jgi:molecular chaperone GrpE